MIKNNKGQVLIETLVTSVLIVSVLVYLFIQLRNMSNSYSITSHYNTVNAIYAADNFRTFLLNDNYKGADKTGTTSGLLAFYRNSTWTNASGNKTYLDLSNCCGSNQCNVDGTSGDATKNGITKTALCQSILTELHIKQVLMTPENPTTLLAGMEADVTNSTTNYSNIDDDFKKYIKHEAFDDESGVYRLFIKTTEGDFATLKLK